MYLYEIKKGLCLSLSMLILTGSLSTKAIADQTFCKRDTGGGIFSSGAFLGDGLNCVCGSIASSGDSWGPNIDFEVIASEDSEVHALRSYNWNIQDREVEFQIKVGDISRRIVGFGSGDRVGFELFSGLEQQAVEFSIALENKEEINYILDRHGDILAQFWGGTLASVRYEAVGCVYQKRIDAEREKQRLVEDPFD